MTRLVGMPVQRTHENTLTQVSADTGDTLTGYATRVAKLVPVEIIAAFMAIRGFLPSQDSGDAWAPEFEIVLFTMLVGLTSLYLLRVGGDVPRKGRQIAIATISFVIWSYAVGGPFFWNAVERLAHHRVVYPGFGGAILVLWSLAAGLLITTDSTQ